MKLKILKKIPRFINCKHGIGVNSGTDAIQIALMSLNIKNGDEVITVSNISTKATIISSDKGSLCGY